MSKRIWQRTGLGAAAAVFALTAVPAAVAVIAPSGEANADVCASAGRRITVGGCANLSDVMAPYVVGPTPTRRCRATPSTVASGGTAVGSMRAPAAGRLIIHNTVPLHRRRRVGAPNADRSPDEQLEEARKIALLSAEAGIADRIGHVMIPGMIEGTPIVPSN